MNDSKTITIGIILILAVGVACFFWGKSEGETQTTVYINPLQYEEMIRKVVSESTNRQDITNKLQTVKNYYSQETNNFLALPDSMKLGETYNNSLELLGE